MIKQFVIGFEFKYKAPTDDAVLVLRSDSQKYVITTEGDYLTATAEVTAAWKPGDYLFQLLTSKGLCEAGEISLLANYALADAAVNVKTPAQQMVEAIEAVIEGRATQSQKSMSVGDKSISYMDLDELLKYLDYFRCKAQKEKDGVSIADEHISKYVFRDVWR